MQSFTSGANTMRWYSPAGVRVWAGAMCKRIVTFRLSQHIDGLGRRPVTKARSGLAATLNGATTTRGRRINHVYALAGQAFYCLQNIALLIFSPALNCLVGVGQRYRKVAISCASCDWAGALVSQP